MATLDPRFQSLLDRTRNARAHASAIEGMPDAAARVRYLNAVAQQMGSAAGPRLGLAPDERDAFPVVRSDRPVPDDVDASVYEHFEAHVGRDIGLARVMERTTEMLGIAGVYGDFSRNPEFNQVDWAVRRLDENVLNHRDLIDIALREGPMADVRNEEHAYWLLGLRQVHHEWDRIIADEGLVSSLLYGFGAQFVNPLNYIIPAGVARMAGGGAAAGAGASRMAWLARNAMGPNIARGAITAGIDESVLTALDYEDRGWQEAFHGLIIGTVFDASVQSIFLAAGRVAGRGRSRRGGGDDIPAGDGGGEAAPVARSALDDMLSLREMDEADAAATADVQAEMTAWLNRQAEADRVEREAIKERAEATRRMPEPVTRTADGVPIYRTREEATAARRVWHERQKYERSIDPSLPLMQVRIVPLLDEAGFALIPEPARGRRVNVPVTRLDIPEIELEPFHVDPLAAPEPPRVFDLDMGQDTPEAITARAEATRRMPEPVTAADDGILVYGTREEAEAARKVWHERQRYERTIDPTLPLMQARIVPMLDDAGFALIPEPARAPVAAAPEARPDMDPADAEPFVTAEAVGDTAGGGRETRPSDEPAPPPATNAGPDDVRFSVLDALTLGQLMEMAREFDVDQDLPRARLIAALRRRRKQMQEPDSPASAFGPGEARIEYWSGRADEPGVVVPPTSQARDGAAFAALGPRHADFEANVIQPLIQQGVMTEDEAAIVRAVFASSALRWSGEMAGFRLGDDVRMGDGGELRTDGTGQRLGGVAIHRPAGRVLVGLAHDLAPGNQAVVLLHELGHAVYARMAAAYRARVADVYQRLRDSGRLEDFIRRVLGVTDDDAVRHLMQSDGELWAHTFAVNLWRRGKLEASMPGPIRRALHAAAEYVRDVLMRLRGRGDLVSMRKEMDAIIERAGDFRAAPGERWTLARGEERVAAMVAVDDGRYELLDETDLRDTPNTTFRSGHTQAVRAVAEAWRKRVGKTTNPVVRLITSPNLAIRAAGNRLFRSGVPLKGSARGTVFSGVRWSTVVEQQLEAKRRAQIDIGELAREVTARSVGRMRGLASDAKTALIGRGEYREAVWNLVDQTVAEAGMLIAQMRQAAGGVVDESAIRATLKTRIMNRLTDPDSDLAARGVTPERLDVEYLVSESIRRTGRFDSSVFSWKRHALVITRRMDAGSTDMPRTLAMLRAVGDTAGAAKLREAIDRFAAGEITDIELDNARVAAIGSLNERRLSVEQLMVGLEDEIRAALMLKGLTATRGEVRAALWARIEPDLAIGYRTDVADAIPDDLVAFGRHARPSATKAVGVNADATVNAGLRQAMQDTYRELGLDSSAFDAIDDMDRAITQFAQDMDAMSGRYGTRAETAEAGRPAQDAIDLERLIRLEAAEIASMPDTMERACNSMQRMISLVYLIRSVPATIFETAQTVATTAGAWHIAHRAIPAYARAKRQLRALEREHPELIGPVLSMLDHLTALSPVRNDRWLERIGQFRRADLDETAAPSSVAARIGAMVENLIRIATDAGIGGKIPLLQRVPILGSLPKIPTLGGMGEIIQKVAAFAHASTVWDWLPDFVEIDRRVAAGESVESAIAAVRAGGARLKGLQPVMYAEIRDNLSPGTLAYVGNLRGEVDRIITESQRLGLSDTEINARLIREVGVARLGGTMFLVDLPGNGMHSKAMSEYNGLLDYLAKDISTTTPRATTQPLRVTTQQSTRLLWQFAAHPATFISSGIGSKVGLFTLTKQAQMMGLMMGAATLDKISRQWISHGWDEGNERISAEWENGRPRFVADVIGRSSFLGLFEKFLRAGIAAGGAPSGYHAAIEAEWSIQPPFVSYLASLNRAAWSLTHRDDLTESDRRNLERILIVRESLYAKVFSHLLHGDDSTVRNPHPREQQRATRALRRGAFRLEADGKISTADERRRSRYEQLDAMLLERAR